MVLNPTMKNANNAAVLADYGIQYDNPLTPMEVADIRTERINKEKVRQQAVSMLDDDLKTTNSTLNWNVREAKSAG